MKHLRLLFISLSLLCTAIVCAQDFYIDGIYYSIYIDGTNTLSVTSGENRYSGDLIIPETVTHDGVTYSVESITSYAFSICPELTSVRIPKSVGAIATPLFYRSDALASIVVDSESSFYDSRENCNAIISKSTNTLVAGCKNSFIPDGVTSIGKYAFFGCEELVNIEIPNSVTSIGERAFYQCGKLAINKIPNSVTSIGMEAFDGCRGIVSLTIGNGVTSIGERAFGGCGFTDIEIPNSVTSIGNQAFGGCSALKSVTIGNGIKRFGDKVFEFCDNLATVTIAEGVTSIGREAFAHCSSLTSIEIPNSVTSIGDRAFTQCSALKSVTIGSGVKHIGSFAFNGCTELSNIVVDSGNRKYDSRENCNSIIDTEYDFLICGCKNSFIPNGVTEIRDYAFSGCFGLTDIEIPNSVTSIGDRAFRECSALKSVTIGNGVKHIGSDAFSDCTTLTRVVSLIPAEDLFAIGDDAFYRVDKTTCTLFVPIGTKETYSRTNGWKDFMNIVEIDATGIADVVDAPSDGVSNVYYDLNGIKVGNASKGIYVVNGKKVLVK